MPSFLPIEIVNITPEAIPSFAIMKPVETEIVNGKWVIQVAKPDDEFERYYLINGPCRIKSFGGTSFNKYATLYDNYPCYALVEKDGSGDFPARKEEWGAKNGSWALHKGRSGFTIWGFQKETVGGIPGGTALNRQLVKQIEVRTVRAKLSADLNQGSSCSAVVWVLDETGTPVASEYTITVYDWLLKASTKIASGTIVICEWLNGQWIVDRIGDCPQAA